jgi:hypothetical protein
MGLLPEADAAQSELPNNASCPAAHIAAGIALHGKLWFAALLHNQTGFCQTFSSRRSRDF